MLRVDSLDERGNSLLDAMLPDTDPFRACRRELVSIIERGCEENASLRVVFQHLYEYRPTRICTQSSRTHAYSFCASKRAQHVTCYMMIRVTYAPISM